MHHLRAWCFCVAVFIHGLKVKFMLAVENTAPITDLRASVTALTSGVFILASLGIGRHRCAS